MGDSIRQIILIGAPNSGKTSLFNHFTQLKYKTVNYPGSTVESAIGALKYSQEKQYPITITDTPGVISLDPKSEDEKVTLNLLNTTKNSMVVLVINATQLQRQLALFKQLAHMKLIPTIVLSMEDVNHDKIDQKTLSAILGTQVFSVNATHSKDVKIIGEFLGKLAQDLPEKHQKPMPVLNETEIKDTIVWAENIAKSVTKASSNITTYDPDQLLLHTIWGPLIFCGFLFTGFWSVFSIAEPMMNNIDALSLSIQAGVTTLLPPGIVTTILAKGIIPSIGGILIFVPQIALLFLLIGILESSGYLARGAALLDHPLSKIGLNGRSFAPLLSGFVCAIPAILSARTIPNKKERLITQLVIPLMSCSARLPVYGLLLTLLAIRYSPAVASIGMISIYGISILIGAGISTLLNSWIPKTENTGFYIELPKLQKPDFKVIIVQSMHQTIQFIKKAGPIIFIVGLTLWALSAYPTPQHSYAKWIGKYLNPIWTPMGVDWRVGVALILSFAAREIFVSAIAVIFAIESSRISIINTLGNATLSNGTPLFSKASIIGLIIFFMISMQCMSTMAVLKQETGQWKWPIIITIMYTFLGYLAAVVAYQVLS